MPLFKLPVEWILYGTMKIEADTFEAALAQAYGEEPLPDGEYAEDSFKVDFDFLTQDQNNDPDAIVMIDTYIAKNGRKAPY